MSHSITLSKCEVLSLLNGKFCGVGVGITISPGDLADRLRSKGLNPDCVNVAYDACCATYTFSEPSRPDAWAWVETGTPVHGWSGGTTTKQDKPNPFLPSEKPMLEQVYEYAILARPHRDAEYELVVPLDGKPFPRVVATSPRDAEVAAYRAIPRDYDTKNVRVLVRPFCG
ncbi:MAG TPA: hypothetical protein VM243_12010 [Phycisphaerae bacterium]|nr:hypothetical protein [Phycisphaerae bacterium]